MILWRVSNHLTLDGRGGLRASGRWHTRGSRIVYCAPNPATALLEILVHAEIDVEDVPTRFRYIRLEAPDSLVPDVAEISSAGDIETSRRAGDEWLRSGRTALLRVPSVIVPLTWNLVINPRHPDASLIRLLSVHDHPVDPRLFR